MIQTKRKPKNNNMAYTIHIRLNETEYNNIKKLAEDDTRTITNLAYKVLKGALGL